MINEIKELKKQNARLNFIMANIIKLLDTDVVKDCGVEKKILHTSETALIQLTKLAPGLSSEVIAPDFNSEIIVIDGEIEVNYRGEKTFLHKNNRFKKLHTGENAKGTAIKHSAVITIIDIEDES